MAEGLFLVGFSIAEILAIQATAKANLTAGITLTSWSVGESTSQSQLAMNTMQILDECQYALKRLDPSQFGAPITRTLADFS